MLLNKTTEYALTVMGYMATDPSQIQSADSLHEKLSIPKRYLRRLMTDLSKHGFLKVMKGRNGGFIFNEGWESINLAQIIQRIEGNDLLSSCILGFHKCEEGQSCVMHETWKEAKQKTLETLSETTLKDLYDRHSQKRETDTEL